MAQVAKTAGAPTTTASIAAARYANAAANVATVSQSAVEGSAASNSISFNAAAYSFRDDRSNSFAQDNQPPPHRMPALVAVAPSQTFAAIVEARNALAGAGRAGPTTTGRGFSGLLSRAISIYETNAKIIHGTADFRGGTVSIRL
jgi:hypothetical protein